MDIENMKAFVSVAELRSISAAAMKLNHLQSNMTAKIKKIEMYYNQELFIRNSKGVKLTKQGEKLYHQFKKILHLWEETENKMKKQDEKLRIGTMISVGGTEFSSALNKLYNTYPDLAVTLKTGSTEYIENQVLLGQIDVAYTIGSLNNKKIRYKEVGVEEMVVIGRGIDQHTTFDDYVRQKNILVLSDKCLYMTILHNIYVSLNIEQGDIIEVGDPETLVQFALMGMGISLVSKRIANRYNINNYLEVPSPYRYTDFYLISRLNYEFTPIEKQFIELNNSLSDTFKGMEV
ncbi:LysR family transcriptional regulator [Priestia megaterium]|jgi:DNA-binding transcriptional LysR family regulator|uniref:Transcriptional regulator family n=7 Tax=Priestia TaxID=2800373 RepID=D5E1Y4_PRIM1|nr:MULTISPECIES: LysR family transcriptional regulator [Priestia]AVX09627.1 LysR family transcriptional regulator [Bacillus sp. Y-01]KOP75745.1 transcriptional regulator [Bacillus sp. FJAT-21351]KQU14103.1 transcriptional regulator [Bacillus sp. Leaf75]MBZ5481230.1 LysR family transcriptional regulator [Bacillus sp. T_4]MDH6653306.1 DNA-binding transcriptional LysR family regulator [Bacillus sp. PvP124]RFB26148.1 LysR family transcriptional regulator [Bacillus sp. ALD]